ncbi:MAG: GtrA family protein [Candidatus Brocadiaceae bacterium]|nr:GtrA family protein [Candidatus Brocadiaceae bacterium]
MEFKIIFTRFIKFTGVGAIGTIAHYITLACLVQLITNVNIVLASSVGALIGAVVNYLLNYRFTFESDKRHTEAFGKFFTIASLGFVLNGLFMALLTQNLDIYYLLAQIVTTGIVLIWNFLGNYYWTFREANAK